MSVAVDTHLVFAAVHMIPALVWGTMAYHAWLVPHAPHRRSKLFLLLPVFCTLVAVHFVLHALIELTPTELEGRAAGLHAAFGALIVLAVTTSMAVMRHLVWTIPLDDTPPSRAWLTVNYGVAAAVNVSTVVAAVTTRSPAEPAGAHFWMVTVPMIYAIAISALALRHGARLARRGAWRPSMVMVELRRPDIVVLGVTLLGVVGIPILAGQVGAARPSVWGLLVHTAVGLGLAVPIAVRMLGEFAQSFLLVLAVVTAAVATAFGARAIGDRVGSPELSRVVDLSTLAALMWILGPGRLRFQATIDRVLFRRAAIWQAELQTCLQTLAPELGVGECCRRVLAVFTQVMGLRGSGILLRDGTAIAHGDFRLDSLALIWPLGAADSLPRYGLTDAELRELPLPLREALAQSQVTAIGSITSPRGHWGRLFASRGLLAAPAALAEVSGFLGQLALVLDAADLLARTLAVERALAHAEKLAAIGETAARIAHEIRNPVTAARSLAQQLARSLAAPADAEAAELILAELARVERQVASLLRFARREELRLEPVDLGALAAATVTDLRPGLEAAGVVVELDTPAGVVARADREKVRQVLINLIENARDALAGADGGRALHVQVSAADGTVSVLVRDTGIGVPADALPHLFEPFFSLKPHGTGLGLAIVRRTVEAHGGRIVAEPAAGSGLVVRMELPRGEGEA